MLGAAAPVVEPSGRPLTVADGSVWGRTSRRLRRRGRSGFGVEDEDLGGPDARARICGNSSFDGTVYVAYEDWAKVLTQEFGQIFQGKGPSGRWLYTPQFIISRLLNNCPAGKQLPPSAGYYYSYWTK